ncbi:MAG: hypothetical protein NTX92_02480, partial [Euryarchaeota archaeon]|nr:hypothetical protein [Euryarchaeota archaeon]
ISRHFSITIEYDFLLKKGFFSNKQEKQDELKKRLSNDEAHIIPEITDLVEHMDKDLIKKLSQLDLAVNSETRIIFNMFARFNEESLRLYNE